MPVWRFAEQASVRMVGRVVVLAFPAAIALLLLLPAGIVSLAVFALIYGAAQNFKKDIESDAYPGDAECYHLPAETKAALEAISARKRSMGR